MEYKYFELRVGVSVYSCPTRLLYVVQEEA
jgi:hypothetical protein